MRKGMLVVAIALAIPALAVARGSSPPTGIVDVTTGDDFFQPEVSHLLANDLRLRWNWNTTNQHNVRQDNKVFYSGTPATTGSLTIRPSAGTYGYYCELHGFKGGGMAGEVRVTPLITSQKETRQTIMWAGPESDTGTRFDVRRRIGKKKPEVIEEKTRDFEGTFKVKPGTKTKFEIRSRLGKAVSDWSPPAG